MALRQLSGLLFRRADYRFISAPLWASFSSWAVFQCFRGLALMMPFEIVLLLASGCFPHKYCTIDSGGRRLSCPPAQRYVNNICASSNAPSRIRGLQLRHSAE